MKVPNVTWSTSLQKEAEDWVKYLAKNDKLESSGKGFEMMFALWGPSSKPKDLCSQAIWLFHAGEKDYDYSNQLPYGTAGHFTQVTEDCMSRFASI